MASISNSPRLTSSTKIYALKTHPLTLPQDMVVVDDDHPQFQAIANPLLAFHDWRLDMAASKLEPNQSFREFVSILYHLHTSLPNGLSYHNFINVHYAPQW